jgi:hypothetical protein
MNLGVISLKSSSQSEQHMQKTNEKSKKGQCSWNEDREMTYRQPKPLHDKLIIVSL